MSNIYQNTTIGGDSSNTEQNGGTVLNGVGLFVSSGGTASGVTAEAGGYIHVYENGTAISAFISGGTLETVGTTTFTSAMAGGNILVSSGGSSDNDTIGPNGQETVWGTASNLTLSGSGAHAYLSAGGSGTNWTNEDGGWVGVYNGATLNGINVTGSDTFVDVQGGHVTNATATNGGILQIESGVTVSVISATSGGAIQVSGGGTAEQSFIGTNGVVDVYNGGVSISATLKEPDATLNLSGGTASGTILSAGAVNVYTSGELTDTTVQSGIINLSGGSAKLVSATNGSGGIIVYDGGSLTSATLQSGGYVHISAGGTATFDTVLSNGTEYVENGGSSISAQVLTSNANIIVSGGGVAADAKIISGYGTVYDSGTMVGGSIQSGIITVSGGLVANINANNGGGFDVSGGNVSALHINTGSFINLYNGGSATDITGSGSNLSNGNGGINVFGGSLTSASFQDGSTLSATGGTLQNITFNNNGHGFASNASLTNTTINTNGNLIVYDGATTNNTVVSGANAFEAVSAGGSSINAIIRDGGNEYANAGATIINPTAENGGAITIHDQGILSDATIQNGASLSIQSGGQLSGTVTLLNGGTASIYSDAGGTIVMDGDTNAGLVISGLTEGGIVNTVISGFNGASSGNSDGIVLDGIKEGDVLDVSYDANDTNKVWINLKNGHAIGLTIDGVSQHGNALVVGNDGNLIYEVCFLSGSMIRTPEGEIPVENLVVGTEVITLDWQNNKETTRPVVWIGKAQCNVRPDLPDDEAGYPVRVCKNALAEGIPYKDMLITAEHCLFFDGKFVPVRMLVNGISIFYDKSITSYDYYHVETDQHSVIIADGMLTESYLDTGNRRNFCQKGTVIRLRGTHRNWEEDAGAPLCVDRVFVEPLFHKLKARNRSSVEAPVSAELTYDPNLYLFTENGTTLHPIRQDGQHYSFMLPANTNSVRIVSRANRPTDVIGPFVNDRRLMGVAVGDVHLLSAKHQYEITSHLQAKKPDGWHDTDWTDCAWTNGNAVLPLEGYLSHGNIGILSITIRAAGPFLVHNENKVDTKRSA
ncbi:Hint domain-containing protein [Acetobacter ascendens]|uniref:Adhesin/invasin TibA autotransporter n=1 Tax=Acetobacter ascendens TaxID=481146 RepID=A0A1Y0UWR8_9PROT|nr:Hint domain-containing protein [Acetobacter ascendens]ARW10225.1 Adhesin/invasin TibA autotransporter [Acetobacter ascendens]